MIPKIFRKLLEADEDHGAAFAVYHRGEMMVNLAGGYADKQLHRVWTLDTLSNLFSVSQGITAIVVALLVDRYWGTFAKSLVKFERFTGQFRT